MNPVVCHDLGTTRPRFLPLPWDHPRGRLWDHPARLAVWSTDPLLDRSISSIEAEVQEVRFQGGQRTNERFAAALGGDQAAPRFEPAARVPHVGLFLALPALESTKLLPRAANALAEHLKPGFYSLETILLEAVLRALAGEPRTEGDTRLEPESFGRVLGLDRAPEVKTLRRRHREIADTEKVGDLLEAMAFERFAHTKGPTDGGRSWSSTSTDTSAPTRAPRRSASCNPHA